MTEAQKTIWKRRALLMAAIALIVAIPVTIAIRGGDDDSQRGGDGRDRGGDAPTLPEVGDREYNKELGVQLRIPKGWDSNTEEEVEEGGVLKLRSGDSDAAVAISAPGPADEAGEIFSQALDDLEVAYRKVRVLGRSDDEKIGGLRSQSAAVSAQQPEGEAKLRILVSVAEGEKKAYLIEVFTSAGDDGGALIEAQALINDLELKG